MCKRDYNYDPISMGALEIIDIETQCKVIKCAVIANFLRDIQQQKILTEPMLNHFSNAKQGINLFKTYVPTTNRSKQDQFYRDLLIAWIALTNNDKVEPLTLEEIYNEPLLFNKSSITHNNQSEYQLRNPPPWAREDFRTIADLCRKIESGFISLEEFLSANKMKIVRYSPKPKDFHEPIKLIPQDWKHTERAYTTEESKVKIQQNIMREVNSSRSEYTHL